MPIPFAEGVSLARTALLDLARTDHVDVSKVDATKITDKRITGGHLAAVLAEMNVDGAASVWRSVGQYQARFSERAAQTVQTLELRGVSVAPKLDAPKTPPKIDDVSQLKDELALLEPPAPKGINAVLCVEPSVYAETNAANLADKEGNARFVPAQLSVLGKHDQLSLVGSGNGRGKEATFGGKSAQELATQLRHNGVKELASISLKGSHSVEFAKELLVALKAEGINVPLITAREDLVTVTTTGKTLTASGGQWLHQASEGKVEVRWNETNDGPAVTKPYAKAERAAVEKRSEDVRKWISEGALPLTVKNPKTLHAQLSSAWQQQLEPMLTKLSRTETALAIVTSGAKQDGLDTAALTKAVKTIKDELATALTAAKDPAKPPDLRALESAIDGLGKALAAFAETPSKGETPLAKKQRHDVQLVAARVGELMHTASGLHASLEGAFLDETPVSWVKKDIPRNAEPLLKELQTQGWLTGAAPNFTLRSGYYAYLLRTHGDAKELPVLNATLEFLGTRSLRLPNTEERYAAFESKLGGRDIYKDWFHQLANTISLLSVDLPKEQMVKLLSLSLMQHQLNATYSVTDSEAFGRQSSPLAMQGYGRGVRSGPWLAAQVIGKEQVEAFGLKLDKGFYVLPVTKAYQGEGAPEIVDPPTSAINGKTNVYIPSLGLQLIKADPDAKKRIDQGLGGEGLRKSPSECAEICANHFAELIGKGKPKEAIAVLKTVLAENPAAKTARAELDKLELRPNTLLASVGVDPVRQSSPAMVEALGEAYKGLVALDTDPFIVRQNFAVLHGLIGDDVTALFSEKTPSPVSAALLDAFERVQEATLALRKGGPLMSRGVKERAEVLYQALQEVHHLVRFQLDWSGKTEPTIDQALREMLPRSAPKPRNVVATPHGLAMFGALAEALGSKTDHVGILEGAYYETPDLFPKAKTFASVTESGLRDRRVIVLEPHPNNAAKDHITPHDAKALFKTLFATNSGTHTVMLDLTLNHLGEPEVEEILAAAKEHIASGKLNLVLLQSGTKFFQNGMDLANVGTAITFNDGGEQWKAFNTAVAKIETDLPAADQLYLATMLQRNKEPLRDYLNCIRENTGFLRGVLEEDLKAAPNAFVPCTSDDPQTVYVAFKPTDAVIARIMNKPVDELTWEDRRDANVAIYHQLVVPALREAELPAVDRSSFGFNVTNFGECATTVRITPGIEDRALFAAYSRVVTDVGLKLLAGAAVDPKKKAH